MLSFGTLLPKTGQFVYSGPAVEAGVQMAINDVNAAGGISGLNVQLDEVDKRDSGDGAPTDTAHQSTDALLSAKST